MKINMFSADTINNKYNIHHIGIVTNNTRNSFQIFKELGYNSTGVIYDELQNVSIELLNNQSNLLIELVQPLNEKSPVYNFYKKNGVCSNHICYEVEDINYAISDLKNKKFICLFTPVPAIAFQNRLITYVFHKNTGLIELLEKK